MVFRHASVVPNRADQNDPQIRVGRGIYGKQARKTRNAECRISNAEWNALDSAFDILHSAFPAILCTLKEKELE
jgi:hypothetical protein